MIISNCIQNEDGSLDFEFHVICAKLNTYFTLYSTLKQKRKLYRFVCDWNCFVTDIVTLKVKRMDEPPMTKSQAIKRVCQMIDRLHEIKSYGFQDVKPVRWIENFMITTISVIYGT